MDALIPSEFYLSQNFPNPFKEKTKIKYCLPVKSKVKLSVFNSAGDIVKEVVNQIQDAGTYEIEFDGKDLSKGEYYCVIIASDLSSGMKRVFNETKKMILTK